MPNSHLSLEARDLTSIDKVIQTAPRQVLLARTLLAPVTGIAPFASTYRYFYSEEFGKAKFANENSNDVPMVDENLTPVDQPIFRIEVGAQWTDEEINQARMANLTLDTTRAETAVRAVAELENQVAFLGDKAHGIEGLLNNTYSKSNVSASTDTFDNMKPEDIVEAIRKQRAIITEKIGMSMLKPVLGLAPHAYEQLNRRYGEYDSRSIMAVLQANQWFSQIVAIPELQDIAKKGSNSLVVFDNTPSTAGLLIAQPIARSQEEIKDFWTHRIGFFERFGGSVLRRPDLVARLDNI
mgnify:CR=1 FL=1